LFLNGREGGEKKGPRASPEKKLILSTTEGKTKIRKKIAHRGQKEKRINDGIRWARRKKLLHETTAEG